MSDYDEPCEGCGRPSPWGGLCRRCRQDHDEDAREEYRERQADIERDEGPSDREQYGVD